MKTLLFLFFICLFFIAFPKGSKCQEIVKDSTGNYFYKIYTSRTRYKLKPIDSTSCKFYDIKKHNAYRAFKDTFSCYKKNNVFFNIGTYLYEANLSQRNFIPDSGSHANLNLQLSVEYYFVPNVAIGMGFSTMRFKSSGIPDYTPSNQISIDDTDKIVYGCTTIPLFIKFRAPAHSIVSAHTSIAYLPTFVNYEKIRYYSTDPETYNFFTPDYQYSLNSQNSKMISMYEWTIGMAITGTKGLVQLNLDYAMTWADAPYFYYWDSFQNKSISQRFSASGVKLGLSIDIERYFQKSYYKTINNFWKDFDSHNVKPKDYDLYLLKKILIK